MIKVIIFIIFLYLKTTFQKMSAAISPNNKNLTCSDNTDIFHQENITIDPKSQYIMLFRTHLFSVVSKDDPLYKNAVELSMSIDQEQISRSRVLELLDIFTDRFDEQIIDMIKYVLNLVVNDITSCLNAFQYLKQRYGSDNTISKSNDSDLDSDPDSDSDSDSDPDTSNFIKDFFNRKYSNDFFNNIIEYLQYNDKISTTNESDESVVEGGRGKDITNKNNDVTLDMSYIEVMIRFGADIDIGKDDRSLMLECQNFLIEEVIF